MPGNPQAHIHHKLTGRKEQEAAKPDFGERFHDRMDTGSGRNEGEQGHPEKGENNRESFFQRLRHMPFAHDLSQVSLMFHPRRRFPRKAGRIMLS